MTTTTRDQTDHGGVMLGAMWGCQASLWALLAVLAIATLIRWAL